MIWIYMTFLLLFFNELGFIGYQTYIYNVMCMDMFIEGDFTYFYADLSLAFLDSGFLSLHVAEFNWLGYLDPISISEDAYRVQNSQGELIYHVNFSAQVYPACDYIYFQVLQHHVYTAPGDLTLVFFHIENLSLISYSGITIYTIAPFYLSYYVQKVQCFCFEELQLQPYQSVELPVIFYVDPLMDNANWYSLTVEYIFLFT